MGRQEETTTDFTQFASSIHGMPFVFTENLGVIGEFLEAHKWAPLTWNVLKRTKSLNAIFEYCSRSSCDQGSVWKLTIQHKLPVLFFGLQSYTVFAAAYLYPRYIFPSKGIKQSFNARQMVLSFSFSCHAERYFYLVAWRIVNPHNGWKILSRATS